MNIPLSNKTNNKNQDKPKEIVFCLVKRVCFLVLYQFIIGFQNSYLVWKSQDKVIQKSREIDLNGIKWQVNLNNSFS